MGKKIVSTIEQVVSFATDSQVVRTGLAVKSRSLYTVLAQEVKAYKTIEVKSGRGDKATVSKVKVSLENRTAVKAVIADMITKSALPEESLKKVNTLATGVMRNGAGMYRSRQADGKMADVKDATKHKEQQASDKAFVAKYSQSDIKAMMSKMGF